MTVAQTLLAAAGGAALVALAVSLFVLREAWLDLRAVTMSGLRNGRRIVAKRALGAEVHRSISLALFAATAALAFVASIAAARALVPIALCTFLAGVIVLAVDAVRSLKVRRELLDGHGHRPRPR